ncbi:hypothetical protein [Aliiruegeria lutimaris]|uniref:Uncharacterized protein n=1 Tax=Aliiruegeria lutimaris TaxID=571298 RepID=A0A1G9MEG9_9RHOB|nr:hypothetical protein [Aliiruegeria lutimaris]SDL72524.1 hypothetical protein SAMN04488026_11098 [Aliiruegeria lutimaris]
MTGAEPEVSISTSALKLAEALSRAKAAETEMAGRSQALSAVLEHLSASYPSLEADGSFDLLRRLRDDLLNPQLREFLRLPETKGQPPKPIGEVVVRCAALAAVDVLSPRRDMSKAEARRVVSRALRRSGKAEAVRSIQRWETEWYSRQPRPYEVPKEVAQATAQYLREMFHSLFSDAVTAENDAEAAISLCLRRLVESHTNGPDRDGFSPRR